MLSQGRLPGHRPAALCPCGRPLEDECCREAGCIFSLGDMLYVAACGSWQLPSRLSKGSFAE